MPREEGFDFTFVSKALPEDTFTVAEWKGTEGLSMLYEFEITLYAEDPEIDLKAVLQNPATLTIIPEGEEERKIHGIPAVFEQLHEYDEYIYYRLKLVPRLWIADQFHENMLFLDKKVPEIIEEILKQVGLTSQDYELKLTGSYKPWEYICQYNETDFDFLSRWMEREGIYYYFDQRGDAEKLIITDSSTAHQPIEGGAVLYSPPSQATGSIYEQVQEFTCRQQILPQKVVLKDYNYRKPSLDLKGEADVDSEGRGNVYIYGEHFKTPEEGNALAKIRAEELLCREAVFYGESTVSPFIPGFFFELDEHYRDSYNRKYLITEVTHQGVQAEFLAMAAGTSRITELEGPAYENRFACIPDTPQFRPERKTVKPRIDGTLNAKVDAAGDGQYAEIDDEGRYKVKLPFDQSDSSDGKASRWTRMAQPYAGADYGMHFPLHKGIEVLLTFIDGDPDRPIIAGTVPNPETGSPVKGGNQTQSMIRTGGGNQIRIEDSDGGQQIHMSSPTMGSIISLGAENAGNIYLRTDGTWVSECDGDAIETVGGVKTSNINGGPENKTVATGQNIRVNGPQETIVSGNRTVNIGGSETRTTAGPSYEFKNASKVEHTYGASSTIKASVDNEVVAGAKISNKLAIEAENVYGVKLSTFSGIKKEAVGSLRFKEVPADITKAAASITFQSGASKITLTPGSINIDSPNITLTSSGGMVRMAGGVTIGGRAAFTDNVSMDERLKVNGDLIGPSGKMLK
jgi:type VI secretion system secreted protein VgrG